MAVIPILVNKVIGIGGNPQLKKINIININKRLKNKAAKAMRPFSPPIFNMRPVRMIKRMILTLMNYLLSNKKLGYFNRDGNS